VHPVKILLRFVQLGIADWKTTLKRLRQSLKHWFITLALKFIGNTIFLKEKQLINIVAALYTPFEEHVLGK
jgi:hypothetical protein